MNQPLIFWCKICGKDQGDRMTYRTHMKDHMKLEFYKCNICERFFGNRNLRDDHEREDHEDTKQCIYCGQLFENKNHLEYHIEFKHRKTMEWTCRFCPKQKWKSEWEYQDHVRIKHSVQKKFYECDVCNYGTKYKKNLTRHMKIHLALEGGHRELVYKCKECDNWFSTKNSLKTHIISKHSKDYPYRCVVCEAGFVAKCYLQKHFKEQRPYMSEKQKRIHREKEAIPTLVTDD